MKKGLFTFFLAVSTAAWGATYYIAATGSDSNSPAQAQSKSTPWAHLPGMPNCSGGCASCTPAAGDSFILRGGDTWGNASLGVSWTWSGTAGSRIYLGVDQTWYTGSSWTRPIFDCGGTACAVGTNQLQLSSNYVTVDNIEFTGLHKGSGGWGSVNNVLSVGTYNEVKNCYMHGWSYAAGSTDNSGTWAISAHGGYAYDGTSFHDNVIDGSDNASLDQANGIANGTYVYNNVIRYVVSGLLGNFNEVHDNLVEYNVISYAGDHCNLIFIFHPASGTGLWAYNNVVRHTLCPGGMVLWLNGNAGCTSCTSYAYNNVIYDARGGIAIGAHPYSGPTGTYYIYNNTVQYSAGGCMGNGEASPRSTTYYANNHCIGPGTICDGTGTTCIATGGNLQHTAAQAAAAGYTASQPYAFSPASGSSPTVGAGTSLGSLCAAVPELCRDAPYAVGYDSVNHRVIAPARTPHARPGTGPWDAGAYQYKELPIADLQFAIDPAPALVLPDPVTVVVWYRYLQLTRNVTAFDVRGKLVDKNNLPKPGIYMAKIAGKGQMRKAVVVP